MVAIETIAEFQLPAGLFHVQLGRGQFRVASVAPTVGQENLAATLAKLLTIDYEMFRTETIIDGLPASVERWVGVVGGKLLYLKPETRQPAGTIN